MKYVSLVNSSNISSSCSYILCSSEQLFIKWWENVIYYTDYYAALHPILHMFRNNTVDEDITVIEDF